MKVLTIDTIVKRVARYHPVSRQSVYNHMSRLGIKALGVARPARYPEDTADRILIRLGFKQPKPNGRRTRSRRQLQKEAA